MSVLTEEILADVDAQVYDDYVFLPFLAGSLLEKGGLADLTEWVRTLIGATFFRSIETSRRSLTTRCACFPVMVTCTRCITTKTYLKSTTFKYHELETSIPKRPSSFMGCECRRPTMKRSS